jgi:uncharacterized protein
MSGHPATVGYVRKENMAIATTSVNRPGYPTEPEFHVYEVQGRKHLLESNTLKTWLFNTPEEMEAIKSGFGKTAKPVFPAYPAPRFQAVCFQMTRACNLACSYCFVRNYYDPKTDVLSLDTVKRFAEQYMGKDQMAVSFFGGEPTLCMDRVEEIRAYCLSRCAKTHFSITTNGTLLDQPACGFSSIAEYLGERGFGGIVSIDGPTEIHDMYRKYANGEGSSSKILQNLKAFKNMAYVKKITLRGTFTSEIVKSAVSLKDRLQYLNELMYSGIGQHVSIEPVVLSETSCISGDKELTMMDQDDVLLALEQQYMDAVKWFAGEVNKGRKPKWHQVLKMLERLYFQRPAYQECGAGKGYCSLDVDGSICACHRLQFTKIGHVDIGLDESLRAKWLEVRGYVRKGCNECPVRYVCGSGCKEASLLYYKDIYKPVEIECKLRMIWIKCAFYLLAHCNVADILQRPKQQEAK